ncbi:metalloprotease [Lactobacillus acidophilus]|uniref:M57 family metalloprotease n=1 Tax=Lactobacillus acidophilus TaxID=1579 RepID=UPI000F75971B|nr:M57 family metalloprotease [Lactobacillus acidophilus]AZN76695.1 metalloprotease [Lactobacillus acidophilus]
MRLFNKLLKRITLVGLIGSAVAYYNIPTVRLATNDSIFTIKSSIDQFITPSSSADLSNQPKKASLTAEQRYWSAYFPENQEEERNETAGSRTWARPSANIYIKIKNNPQLHKAMKQAIKNWNDTGVFKFKEVNNAANANIIARDINNKNTTAAGVTSTTYNPLTGHLLTANVALNRHYLQNKTYNYSYQRILNTAEHELGHAIGLNHVNNSSVMQPVGSYYSIQVQDINAVKSLYQS